MKKSVIYLWIIGLGTWMTIQTHAEPLIIAHRGYSAAAPENTVASIRRALALDPPPAYVEIDLHRSSDGILVVSHDLNTRRTTGADKVIRETPFDVLRQLHAGLQEKFGTEFQNEPVPRFEDILDAVKGTPVGVMIECKQMLIEDQVLAILQQRGELKKHIIASFNDTTVYRAKQLEPSVRTLLLAGGVNPDIVWKARDLRADIIGLNSGEKPENIRLGQEQGFQTWVWTVDEENDIQKWIDAGVDGIITNQPERTLKMIK